MTNEEQILIELQKINLSLSKRSSAKVALDNFLAGLFHSVGYFIGTIVIFFVLAFFAQKYNFTAMVSKSFETMMTQINWAKIVPSPKDIQPSN